MADLVYKQAVAVIDKRTSQICLHVAGQVKPPDEPFQTLIGAQDMPPFHQSCRTIVVPWMTGFVVSQRTEATAEIETRSPRQRAVVPPIVFTPPPTA